MEHKESKHVHNRSPWKPMEAHESPCADLGIRLGSFEHHDFLRLSMPIQYLLRGPALPGVWKHGQSCPRTRSSEDLPIPLGPGEVSTMMEFVVKNWTNRKSLSHVLAHRSWFLMEFWSLWIGRCWFCLVMPPFDPPSQTSCDYEGHKKPATCEQM